VIDPEHIDLEVSRVVIESESFEGLDESTQVSNLHTMACMAAHHEWTAQFAFVCLLDEGFIDHFTMGVSDTTPADFFDIPITEVVRFHGGKVLAVAIHLGAFAGEEREDGTKEILRESKYVITISAELNIVVSTMMRDVKTNIPDNDGKWLTSMMDQVPMDHFGDIHRMCRDIQKEIQEQRRKREPNG
jgi:hypothetical protein